MARDFQRLSEVTRIEEVTENASVLVEENGEIYRVPKTAVGAAGGGYMMITLTQDNSYVDNYVTNCSINYDEMYEALLAGNNVWIDVSEISGEPYILMVIGFLLTSEGLTAEVIDNRGFFMGGGILFPNGSHNLTSNPK